MTRGKKIRELRIQHGLSLAQVAAAKPCNESYVSRVERDLKPCRPELFDEFRAAIQRAAEKNRKLKVAGAISELRCVLDHVSSVISASR